MDTQVCVEQRYREHWALRCVYIDGCDGVLGEYLCSAGVPAESGSKYYKVYIMPKKNSLQNSMEVEGISRWDVH